MKALRIRAKDENLNQLNEFIHNSIDGFSVSPKVLVAIDLAVEEIFVNICHYAYAPQTGDVEIKCTVKDKPRTLEIAFEDEGEPFNPLEKDDPDTKLGADERNIGGLGILLTKKFMDGVSYRYECGKNILVIQKDLGE